MTKDHATPYYFEDLEPGLVVNLGSLVVTSEQANDYFRLVSEDRLSIESDGWVPTPLLGALLYEQLQALRVDTSLFQRCEYEYQICRRVPFHEDLAVSVQVAHRQLGADATSGNVGLHLRALSSEGQCVMEGTTSLIVRARSMSKAREMETSRPSFASTDWLALLIHNLSENNEFREAASSFDGSIAVNFGPGAIGLRLYKGRIIDHGRSAISAATFTIAATPSVWHEFSSRLRNEFISFAMSDAIQVQGSMYEYLRMTRAIMALTDEIRALLRTN